MNLVNAINNTIPISSFNRGMAGQIFDDVRISGAKLVIKHNTPACVLISPSEYIRLVEAEEDYKVLKMTLERMATYDPANAVPAAEVYEKFGITEADLSGYEDVDFE